jgi:hypothetical protein
LKNLSGKKLNEILLKALTQPALREAWAENARNYADTQDLYSLADKAADIIIVIWMVELNEPLATLWRGKDAFEEVKHLQGEVFVSWKPRTLRFELAGAAIF